MFPCPSSYLQVTIEVPWVVRVSESLVVPVMVPLQLSLAVGGVLIVAEHCPVTSGKLATLATGAIVSLTVIVCVHLSELPLESVALYVRVIVLFELEPGALSLSPSHVTTTVPQPLTTLPPWALKLDKSVACAGTPL